MINDNRIPCEIGTAIDMLNAISSVYCRDGEIHKNYLREKTERAGYIIDWLRTFYKEDNEGGR